MEKIDVIAILEKFLSSLEFTYREKLIFGALGLHFHSKGVPKMKPKGERRTNVKIKLSLQPELPACLRGALAPQTPPLGNHR